MKRRSRCVGDVGYGGRNIWGFSWRKCRRWEGRRHGRNTPVLSYRRRKDNIDTNHVQAVIHSIKASKVYVTVVSVGATHLDGGACEVDCEVLPGLNTLDGKAAVLLTLVGYSPHGLEDRVEGSSVAKVTRSVEGWSNHGTPDWPPTWRTN